MSERRWLLLVQQQGRQPQSAARAERGSAAHAGAAANSYQFRTRGQNLAESYLLVASYIYTQVAEFG